MVEESTVIEKYRVPLPSTADYLVASRSIIPLTKLQRCDKTKTKTNLFEDIGNSQGSQTLQGQEEKRETH